MGEYSRPSENDKCDAANASQAWAETVRLLAVGTQIAGEVIGRQPFGAFLSIDGHADAVGLARVDRMPTCMELPTLGQRVTGQVIWHADHNHQVGITLSEWSSHEDLLPRFAERVGQVVAGHVTKVAPIGFFVRIASCVEGLVPLTEPVEDLAEAVHEGQLIFVQIIAVDLERSRVLLSPNLASRSSRVLETSTPDDYLDVIDVLPKPNGQRLFL
ncbi:S1 RNA-binding domain-containing protein [Streptomyces lydicus]|uniref:S1 RNA-binding domain-containing protein n=1 Tax=Streptomyces lydicus TaxID=47763 RepID=UPI0034251764